MQKYTLISIKAIKRQLNISYLLFSVAFLSFINPTYSQTDYHFHFNKTSIDSQWIGDRNGFKIENGSLVSFDEEYNFQGKSNLQVPYIITDSTQIRSHFSYNFSPSNSNYLSIGLAKKKPFLNAEGLYLKLGGQSGNEDPLVLYEIDEHGIETTIQTIAFGVFSKAQEIELDATKSMDGFEINLQTNDTLIQTYVPYSLDSNPYCYFSFEPNYSKSRHDKFRIGEVVLSKLQPDTVAPQICKVDINPDSISIFFNESIREIFEIEPLEKNTWKLQNNHLSILNDDKDIWALTIKKATDLYQNSVDIPFDTTILKYATPSTNELIFSEIMIDPTPSQGLVGEEWIEIYNPTQKNFKLDRLILSVNGKTFFLKDEILANQYLLIIDEGKDIFNEISNKIEINLPALTNTEGELKILNNSFENNIVCELIYNKDSYQNEDKSNGGFSLALQSKNYECINNSYAASNSITGGTPGKENVWESLKLVNNKVHENELTLTSNYDIEEIFWSTGLNATLQDIISEEYEHTLFFDLKIESDISFHIDSIMLCNSEMAIIDSSFHFKYQKPLVYGDVIISEVHFAPTDGKSEFIEIVNLSNRDIPSSLISVSKSNEDKNLIQSNKILKPNQYYMLSNSPDTWFNHPRIDTALVIKTKIPALNNDGANLLLSYENNGIVNVLDSVTFSPTSYSYFQKEDKGVSLVRDLLDKNVWSVAINEPFGASPTYKKGSNQLEYNGFSFQNNSLDYTHPLFENIEIHYTLNVDDAILNVWLYDAGGNSYGKIIDSHWVGDKNGTIIWNGIVEEKKLPTGNYILQLELIESTGNVILQKKIISIVN